MASPGFGWAHSHACVATVDPVMCGERPSKPRRPEAAEVSTTGCRWNDGDAVAPGRARRGEPRFDVETTSFGPGARPRVTQSRHHARNGPRSRHERSSLRRAMIPQTTKAPGRTVSGSSRRSPPRQLRSPHRGRGPVRILYFTERRRCGRMEAASPHRWNPAVPSASSMAKIAYHSAAPYRRSSRWRGSVRPPFEQQSFCARGLLAEPTRQVEST